MAFFPQGIFVSAGCVCKLIGLGAVLGLITSLVACSDDQPTPAQVSTAQSNVQVLASPLIMAGLDRERTIRVYLPPNYAAEHMRYPVVYMHDGQNLFDVATAYVGEWGVDETLNRLSSEKNLNAIVVGVDNGAEKRVNELSPWENSEYGPPEGAAYMAFIVDVVKPFIDREFRTLTGPEHTVVMGSSLGGLISHYAIHKYPDVFGKAGIFSPSYWFSNEVYRFTAEKPLADHARVYFLVGAKEGDGMVRDMEVMVAQVLEQGHPPGQVNSRVVELGEHNEAFWGREFGAALEWLLVEAAD